MLLWDPNQVNTLVLKGIQDPHPLWLHYKPLVEALKMPTNLRTIVQ